MFLNNSFGKSLDILQRSMSVATMRHSVIADNLANADTPDFKRSDLNFETMLKKALESETPKTTIVSKDDPFYQMINRTIDYRDVKALKVTDFLTTSDNNGNNVDLEQEIMESQKNQMRYDLMARSVANQFSRVNIVLR